MGHVFDQDKLQDRLNELKSIHTVEPTAEFWDKEMERCYNDPWYYYTHYHTVNGKAPRPISKEEWEQRNENDIKKRIKHKETYQMVEKPPRVNIKFREHVLIFEYEHNFIPQSIPENYILVYSSDIYWHERRFKVGPNYVIFTSYIYPHTLPSIPQPIYGNQIFF